MINYYKQWFILFCVIFNYSIILNKSNFMLSNIITDGLISVYAVA